MRVWYVWGWNVWGWNVWGGRPRSPVFDLCATSRLARQFLIFARQERTHPASSATPPATSMAAIHRRRSTFSCRKIFAANALPMNVSDAAAGATKLTSPHDSANSRLKKATAIASHAQKKIRIAQRCATPQSKIPSGATAHAHRQLASWRAPAERPPPPTRRPSPESRPRCRLLHRRSPLDTAATSAADAPFSTVEFLEFSARSLP